MSVTVAATACNLITRHSSAAMDNGNLGKGIHHCGVYRHLWKKKFIENKLLYKIMISAAPQHQKTRMLGRQRNYGTSEEWKWLIASSTKLI